MYFTHHIWSLKCQSCIPANSIDGIHVVRIWFLFIDGDVIGHDVRVEDVTIGLDANWHTYGAFNDRNLEDLVLEVLEPYYNEIVGDEEGSDAC